MNPFLLVYIIIGGIGIIVTAYMDGAQRPPQKYNLNSILIATLIQWLLVFGAIAWAQNH